VYEALSCYWRAWRTSVLCSANSRGRVGCSICSALLYMLCFTVLCFTLYALLYMLCFTHTLAELAALYALLYSICSALLCSALLYMLCFTHTLAELAALYALLYSICSALLCSALLYALLYSCLTYCMRTWESIEDPSVWGLKLLVYAALREDWRC
jgi:hypothetical protein